MYILGIETSCDDTAAAVIEITGRQVFKVLSNTSYSQVSIHKKFGGVVPNLASRAHLEKIIPTIKNAFRISKTGPNDIGLIAVTRGPGLAPSLLVGINTARALAYKWQKPIIGVNHIEGHIYSNWLSSSQKFSKPIFPALILIVSGGHTELVLMKNHGKYKIIGQTLDDAAGECFDKTARILGLGFPGGPELSRLAEKKSEIRNPKFEIKLPRPMINSNNYNFSFSGLKTATLYLYKDLLKDSPNPRGGLANPIIPAMAAEIQQAIVDVLVAKTLKMARNYNPKIVMIAGGVSANKKLRKEMAKKLEPYKIPLFIPDLAYTTDNAAMIAAAGYFNYLSKKPIKDSWKNIEMDANLKL